MKGIFDLAPNPTPAEIRRRARRAGIEITEGTLGLDDAGRSRHVSENAIYGGPADRFPLYHFLVMANAPALAVAKGPDDADLIFSFRPHPQQVVLTEPAAVNVHALQQGGRYVEHDGEAVGELLVAGTTGLFLPAMSPAQSPVATATRSAPSVDDAGVRSASGPGAHLSPGLGRAWQHIEPANPDRPRDPPYPATGFDRIVELRTFFRTYFALRRERTPGELFLTWLNLKDGEWWLVEPAGFRVPRGVDFRTGYRFEITCKVLGRLDPADPARPNFAVWPEAQLRPDPRPAPPGPTFGDRAASALAHAEASSREVRAAVEKVQSTLSVIIQLGGSVESILADLLAARHALGDTVFDTPRTMFDLLESIGAGVVSVAEVPLGTIEALVRFTEALSRSLPTSSIPSVEDTSIEEDLRALPRVLRRSARDRKRSSFSRSDRGAPPGGTIQVVILEHETLRDLAFRVLGAETRWEDIVLLNDLVPPYLSPIGGTGVLRPGDFILVPAPQDAQLPLGDAGHPVERYGTDLKLVNPAVRAEEGGREIEIVRETHPGGDKLFDFAVVRGVPNLVQALHLQATTEPGELPRHRDHGIAIPVGAPMTPLALFLHKFRAIRSLLRDDRVEAVRHITVEGRGDVAQLRVEVVARGTRLSLQT